MECTAERGRKRGKKRDKKRSERSKFTRGSVRMTAPRPARHARGHCEPDGKPIVIGALLVKGQDHCERNLPKNPKRTPSGRPYPGLRHAQATCSRHLRTHTTSTLST